MENGGDKKEKSKKEKINNPLPFMQIDFMLRKKIWERMELDLKKDKK